MKEIGCGAGLTTMDIAHLMERASITAIDTNTNLIANANK
jgi:trans-aconitate methyltransferase